jgi:hypothetical protein
LPEHKPASHRYWNAFAAAPSATAPRGTHRASAALRNAGSAFSPATQYRSGTRPRLRTRRRPANRPCGAPLPQVTRAAQGVHRLRRVRGDAPATSLCARGFERAEQHPQSAVQAIHRDPERLCVLLRRDACEQHSEDRLVLVPEPVTKSFGEPWRHRAQAALPTCDRANSVTKLRPQPGLADDPVCLKSRTPAPTAAWSSTTRRRVRSRGWALRPCRTAF